MLKHNPQGFQCQFVTMNETWKHHYTHSDRHLTKVCDKGELRFVSWEGDNQFLAIFKKFIDYLLEGQVINKEYCAILPNSLVEELQINQLKSEKKEVFPKDNGLARSCNGKIVLIQVCIVTMIPHFLLICLHATSLYFQTSKSGFGKDMLRQ